MSKYNSPKKTLILNKIPKKKTENKTLTQQEPQTPSCLCPEVGPGINFSLDHLLQKVYEICDHNIHTCCLCVCFAHGRKYDENESSPRETVRLLFTFIHCLAIISPALYPEGHNSEVNVTFIAVEDMDYLQKDKLSIL